MPTLRGLFHRPVTPSIRPCSGDACASARRSSPRPTIRSCNSRWSTSPSSARNLPACSRLRTKSARRAQGVDHVFLDDAEAYYRKYQSFEYWRALLAQATQRAGITDAGRDRRIRLRLRQQHAAAARPVPARTGGRNRHQPEPAGDPQSAAGSARIDRALHRGRDGCAEGLCAARVRRPRRRFCDPASSRRAGALCRAGDAHPAARRRGDLLRAVRGRLRDAAADLSGDRARGRPPQRQQSRGRSRAPGRDRARATDFPRRPARLASTQRQMDVSARRYRRHRAHRPAPP